MYKKGRWKMREREKRLIVCRKGLCEKENGSSKGRERMKMNGRKNK